MNSLRTNSLVVLYALCLGIIQLYGQVPAARVLEQTVEDLGDSTYAVRTDAELRLYGLGRAAVPALEKGLRHTDPEIRARCAALLPLARRSDLDLELDAFEKNQRDAKLPPLPGWARFKGLVGDDRAARLLYVEIFRQEKALLELLEKDLSKVAAQFAPRMQKFQEKANAQGGNNVTQADIQEFQGLMLTALCSKFDQNENQQLLNLFYTQTARSATISNPGTRFLVSRFISARMKNNNQAQQYYYIANYLQLTELIESQILPLLEKEIDAAVKTKNTARLVQVVYMANNLQATGSHEGKLRSAVIRVVEDVRLSEDYTTLQQAVSMCQVLQMQDTLEQRLKPAVARYIHKSADQLKDMSRIYQARYLAQTVGLDEMFNTVLRPAVVKLAAEAADNLKDIGTVHNTFYMANNLNMPEVVEGLLRPAIRRSILSSLEKEEDWNQLNQTVNLCRQINLADLLEETVKPVFLHKAPAMIAKAEKDPNQLQQVYYMAVNLNATKVIEEQLKPALCKYFLTADLDNKNGGTAQMMDLAKNLQMKEVIPFALKAALAKKANANLRGASIMLVGEIGAKEQVAQLETLLKDSTELGQANINAIVVKAQVRDVALAVLLTQKGENLATFGFPVFRTFQGITLYQTSPEWAGFSNQEGRDAAFKKYNELVAKEKK